MVAVTGGVVNSHAGAPGEISRRPPALIVPGQTFEIRALGVQRGRGRPCTESGYFDFEHLRDALRIAKTVTQIARGVYLTLNPLKPEVLARRCNRLGYAQVGEAAKDSDVLSRHLLLFDCDPVRDPHISATDLEKSHARDVITRLRDHLLGLDWPSPVVGDSGNGYHLFFPIDLPADDGGLIKNLLEASAAKYDTPSAKIDTSVGNAARIVKLPNTIARKGDPTPDRPHRVAKLLEKPDDFRLKVVSADMIRRATDLLNRDTSRVIVDLGAKKKPKSSSSNSGKRLDVARWLNDRGVAYHIKPEPDSKGRTVYILDPCPFDAGHGAPDSCIMQSPDGALAFNCFHNSCQNRGWKEVKETIGPPERKHFQSSGTAHDAGSGNFESSDQNKKTVEIILQGLRDRYHPKFRDGNLVHCEDGSIVSMGVACSVPDSKWIDEVADAVDAPRNGDGQVIRNGLPRHWSTWSKTAWGDLLASLPEEDTAQLGDDAPARDTFRRLVREALLTEVVLGDVISGAGHQVVQTQRRSLAEWCQMFAKVGPWRGIRSKRCWTKWRVVPGKNGELMIAIRHELFAQLGADRKLRDMGSKKFAIRAARYGVGVSTKDDRPHGVSAIVLDPAFVADLIAELPDDEKPKTALFSEAELNESYSDAEPSSNGSHHSNGHHAGLAPTSNEKTDDSAGSRSPLKEELEDV
jgi:hypothetical protein